MCNWEAVGHLDYCKKNISPGVTRVIMINLSLCIKPMSQHVKLCQSRNEMYLSLLLHIRLFFFSTRNLKWNLSITVWRVIDMNHIPLLSSYKLILSTFHNLFHSMVFVRALWWVLTDRRRAAVTTTRSRVLCNVLVGSERPRSLMCLCF